MTTSCLGAALKLTEARVIFDRCKAKGEVGFIIRKHCWVDHPERGFSRIEVLNLLMGAGLLKDNNAASAKPDSFLWHCQDKRGKKVEIAVLFDNEQIVAIAISAFRRT